MPISLPVPRRISEHVALSLDCLFSSGTILRLAVKGSFQHSLTVHNMDPLDLYRTRWGGPMRYRTPII